MPEGFFPDAFYAGQQAWLNQLGEEHREKIDYIVSQILEAWKNRGKNAPFGTGMINVQDLVGQTEARELNPILEKQGLILIPVVGFGYSVTEIDS